MVAINHPKPEVVLSQPWIEVSHRGISSTQGPWI